MAIKGWHRCLLNKMSSQKPCKHSTFQHTSSTGTGRILRRHRSSIPHHSECLLPHHHNTLFAYSPWLSAIMNSSAVPAFPRLKPWFPRVLRPCHLNKWIRAGGLLPNRWWSVWTLELLGATRRNSQLYSRNRFPNCAPAAKISTAEAATLPLSTDSAYQAIFVCVSLDLDDELCNYPVEGPLHVLVYQCFERCVFACNKSTAFVVDLSIAWSWSN